MLEKRINWQCFNTFFNKLDPGLEREVEELMESVVIGNFDSMTFYRRLVHH